jgi:hypothetical protein
VSPATGVKVEGASGGFEGWPAGRNLAGDGDDAASRGVAGGGEEEILGEGVRVRVLTRLARVPMRWEVVGVRRGGGRVPGRCGRGPVIAEGRRKRKK